MPLGLTAILGMMVLLVALGFEYLSAVEQGKTIVEAAGEKTRLVYQMREAIRKRSYTLARAPTFSDYFARDQEQQNYFGYAREYIIARDAFLNNDLNAEETAIYEELVRRVRDAQAETDSAMALVVEQQNGEDVAKVVSTAISIQDSVLDILDWMVRHQSVIKQKKEEKAETNRARARTNLIVAAVLTLFLSFITAVYIFRRESGRADRLYGEITHRKHAEAEVRALNHMLEGRVAERTRELESEIGVRKGIDEKLRASEIQSRTIIDTAAIGIIVINEKGTIESFNPAAEKIFRIKAGEAIGENVSSLMPEPYKSQHDGYLKKYLAGGPAQIIGIGREIQGKRQGEGIFPGQLSISEMSVNGERKFIGMIDDITPQKLAEKEVLLAKEIAETASESKSGFLANMSHELRTPLNAIIGYSEAMQMEMFGSLGHIKYKEYIVNIIHSGRHLLDLVNDILDISAIESGKMELDEDIFPPAPLAEECLNHVRGWANREGNRLALDMAPDLPDLKGDRRRIKQIILNLLSNAIKFTPSGGIITLRVGLGEDGRFSFSVIDTGCGMKAEDIAKAFSAFQQIGRGVTSRHEGSGLGLALSRNFALLHEGNLVMKSDLDKGTTVTLSLPARRVLSEMNESVI